MINASMGRFGGRLRSVCFRVVILLTVIASVSVARANQFAHNRAVPTSFLKAEPLEADAGRPTRRSIRAPSRSILPLSSQRGRALIFAILVNFLIWVKTWDWHSCAAASLGGSIGAAGSRDLFLETG